MKGWVGLVGWTVADGLPTTVVTHQVKRRTRNFRQPETDVLPLCHATNLTPCHKHKNKGKKLKKKKTTSCTAAIYLSVTWLNSMPALPLMLHSIDGDTICSLPIAINDGILLCRDIPRLVFKFSMHPWQKFKKGTIFILRSSNFT